MRFLLRTFFSNEYGSEGGADTRKRALGLGTDPGPAAVLHRAADPPDAGGTMTEPETDGPVCRYCGEAVAWKGFAPFGSKFSHGECLTSAVLEGAERVDT